MKPHAHDFGIDAYADNSDDNNRQAGATFTITAVPRWAEQGHLHDSEQSILLAEVRGAPISASGSGQASVARCMEAEA